MKQHICLSAMVLSCLVMLIAGCKSTTEPSNTAKTATLSAYVKITQKDTAIIGATVQVTHNGFEAKGTTNDSGLATFTIETAGWYHIIASAPGYEDDIDSVEISLGQTYIVTLPLRPAPPVVNYADSLIACYRFANNFLDSSSAGHDGARHGCTFVADRFGNASNAIQFNGTTDYITIPDAPDLNFGKSGSFTIMMWLNFAYPPNTGQDSYMLYKGTSASGSFIGYYAAVNGHIQMLSVAGTTYGVALNSTGPGSGGGPWHLYAFSFDRTGFLGLSVDGGPFGAWSTGGLQSLNGNINTTAPLMIGGIDVAANAFKGKMDDVRIYHGIPPASYMDSLYHEYGW